MEVWVQGALFERGPTTRAPGGRIRLGLPGARQRGRHPGWSPVTRDPAVASSYNESARIASDMRVGLARAYERLSPELRASIRAALTERRSRTAA